MQISYYQPCIKQNIYSCELLLDDKLFNLYFDNTNRIIRNLEDIGYCYNSINVKVFRMINNELELR